MLVHEHSLIQSWTTTHLPQGGVVRVFLLTRFRQCKKIKNKEAKFKGQDRPGRGSEHCENENGSSLLFLYVFRSTPSRCVAYQAPIL